MNDRQSTPKPTTLTAETIELDPVDSTEDKKPQSDKIICLALIALSAIIVIAVLSVDAASPEVKIGALGIASTAIGGVVGHMTGSTQEKQ